MSVFRITYDMSAVSQLEGREQRYIKAINNNINNKREEDKTHTNDAHPRPGCEPESGTSVLWHFRPAITVMVDWA